MLRTRLVAGVTSGVVMGAVFATALTAANFGEAFVEPWRVDPGQPAPISLRLPRTTVRAHDEETGLTKLRAVPEIVSRGEVVTDPVQASVVRAYERGRRPPRPTHLAAQWAVYFALVVLATWYMRKVSAKSGALLRTQVSLLGLSLLFLLGMKLLLLLTDLSAFVLPIALLPLWTSQYLDRRTGTMMAVLLSLFGASLVVYDPIVSVVYLISSCIAALTFRAARKQSVFLIVSGAISGVVGAATYVATKEILDGFSLAHELALGPRSAPIATLSAGTLAGVVAFLLQPAVSRVFGVVSRAQLLTLTDLEQPLLKKMAAEAPGSWAHARAMANLAEAASAAIGCDALLTRVGAYYHDLGKTVQAKYFVENLDRGERSPHEDLDPDISADAIMAHVVEGTRILREGRIPEAVIEFVYTHHGTSVIEYFWHKCLSQGNPKALTEDAFRYPGMRPRTRETAILMLVDSVEAGARTVDPPTREKFLEMVQRVLFVKLQQAQLDESGLRVADLRELTAQLTDTLCSSYHKRIRYPWQEAADRGETPLPMPATRDADGTPLAPTETGKFRQQMRDAERDSGPADSGSRAIAAQAQVQGDAKR
ncbi:MAG TPA: HDIG domain-containing protein [Polyangiales bacterium]